jgi:predicted amidohydrolase YtcJ
MHTNLLKTWKKINQRLKVLSDFPKGWLRPLAWKTRSVSPPTSVKKNPTCRLREHSEAGGYVLPRCLDMSDFDHSTTFLLRLHFVYSAVKFLIARCTPRGNLMTQRSLFLFFVVCTFLAFWYFTNTMPREATTLFVNATVHTLDPAKPVVQAIAVHHGRIVGTGSSEELLKKFSADTVIDLSGKTVVPGLIDAHGHVPGLGRWMQSIALLGITSPEEVAALIRERIKQVKPGRWVYGRGWDQNLWKEKQFPTKALLDAAVPDNPVVLVRVDGHAIWVNSKAMEIAGISAQTQDPPGGRITRDNNGNPTGVFIDKARALIEDHFPPPSDEEIEERLLMAMHECVRNGLTEVHDMGENHEVGVDAKRIDIYKSLVDDNRLPLRIYAAVNAPGEAWNIWSKRKPLIGYGNDMLTVRSMKTYMDGALGSRGAALIEEYADDPGNRGLTLMSEDDHEQLVKTAIALGFQPCTHAIGDRGNQIVLNVYEKVLGNLSPGDYRARVEHVQVLSPDGIPRFKQLNVLPSMQPTHATSDMYWVEARLGPERVKGAYAWRSLLESGSIILGGSDFPVESPNPLWGFYAAITRSDHNGYPADGWYGKQKMTREEALKAFTIWAAYGAFQEKMKGTLEYGKYADLTVLSKDIMTISPKEILETEVIMTIVGGRIVYKEKERPVVP